MKDDFDFESLAETWKEHPTGKKFQPLKLKRQLLLQKLYLLSLSSLEIIIIAAIIWALLLAYNESWPMVSQLWLTVGLVAGLTITLPMMKSRWLSYKHQDLATQNWIKYQLKLSQQALLRGKLTSYLIFIFAIALTLFLIYELTLQPVDLFNLGLRYSFGILWLVVSFLINRRLIHKHALFIKQHLTKIE